jgi:hypothetical protein
MSDQIRALQHEMEMHAAAGRVERVAQIKDELAGLGAPVKGDGPLETAAASRPRKSKSD